MHRGDSSSAGHSWLIGPAPRAAQPARQRPQAIQRDGLSRISGCGSMPSGLWHQMQRSGQPFRKTVVRIPGPSSSEYRWMLKTVPLGILQDPRRAAAGTTPVP